MLSDVVALRGLVSLHQSFGNLLAALSIVYAWVLPTQLEDVISLPVQIVYEKDMVFSRKGRRELEI